MNRNKKKKSFQMVGWRITEEEMQMLEALKKKLMRKSTSDVLRFLVVQEYKKNFAQNNII
jgi:hypothetical protein